MSLHICTLETVAVFVVNDFDNVINCLSALPAYAAGERYVDGLLFVLMDGCLLQNTFYSSNTVWTTTFKTIWPTMKLFLDDEHQTILFTLSVVTYQLSATRVTALDFVQNRIVVTGSGRMLFV